MQQSYHRTLADLRPGERGTVRDVGGDPALRRRLLDLGFTPGAEVGLARVAPMGDPVEARLRGYSLTLRREDARLVTLR